MVIDLEEHVLKTVLLAQIFYPEDYRVLVGELEKLGSWDLTNEQVKEVFVQFAIKISSRLETDRLETKTIESAVPTAAVKSLTEVVRGPSDSPGSHSSEFWRPIAHRAVEGWVQKLRERGYQITSEQAEALKSQVKERAAKALSQVPASDPRGVENALLTSIEATAQALGVDQAATKAVRPAAAPAIEATRLAAERIHNEAVRDAFSSPSDIVRKDLVYNLHVLSAASSPDLTASTVEVEKLARAAQAFSATIPPEEPAAVSGVFFRAAAKTPIQKIIAPLLDVVGGETLARGILAEALGRANQRLDVLLGAAASSPLVLGAIERGSQTLGSVGAAKSAFSAVRSFVWGLAGQFREPADDTLANYLRLAAFGQLPEKIAVTQYHFMCAAASPGQTYFRLGFLPDFAGWLFRRGLGEVGKKAIGTATKEAGKGLVGKILAAAVGIGTGGTGFLVQAAAWLATTLLGRAWSGIKGFFSSIFAPGAPGQRQPDWALIIAAVVLFIIAGPILIPGLSAIMPFLPGSGQQLAETARMSALVVPAKGGGEAPGVIDCNKEPDNPACKFEPCPECEWPVKNGNGITQGPRATCDNSTHDTLNAIDISANYLTPVYSVTAGRVVDVYKNCGDNTAKTNPACPPPGHQYHGRSTTKYGNYVIIETDRGELLIYSHLSQNSPADIKAGASVQPGKPIGAVNNNGNSTGHHLHFGVLSGPNVASFLPPRYANDLGFRNQLEGCINEGGCKSCPAVSFAP